MYMLYIDELKMSWVKFIRIWIRSLNQALKCFILVFLHCLFLSEKNGWHQQMKHMM